MVFYSKSNETEINMAIQLAEKIKQGCDRYRELCILGKDEEGTRLKEAMVKDMDTMKAFYPSLSDDDRKIVDQKVAEAYGHLMGATRVMTGQIKGLTRRLEE